MNALVVEDDKTQLNGIIKILSTAFPEIKFQGEATYNAAIKLIDKEGFDFYLLDIELDKSYSTNTGIDIGRHIRSNEGGELIPILYLTALAYEAPNAIHSTQCYDYLVKPYDEETLVSSVARLLKSPILREQPLRLKGTDGVYFQIYPNDIIYIKSQRRTMHIFTSNRHYTTNSIRLDDLSNRLPSYLIRCHKSYIVNISYIDNIDKINAIITLNLSKYNSIPIGRSYYKLLIKELKI